MKLNIGVVFGGRSVEHEVSVISANQCINAIDKDKYNVIPFYIAKDGQWYTGDKLLDLNNYRDLERLIVDSHKIVIGSNKGVANFYWEPKGIFTKKKPINIDVLFPVHHGTYGEDGTLQGLFEMLNVPYVGCDTLSAAITMDKITTKILLRAANIKVLDYHWFYGEQWVNDREAVIAKIKDKFKYPLIVKPGNLGSSIGISVVNNDSELEDGIDLAIRLAAKVLVEPKITNLKEVNCSVLGDRDQNEVSVCEEPVSSEFILSYNDKYAGGLKGKGGIKTTGGGMSNAKRKIPADISEEMSKEIQEIGKKAFIELNCNGVVRIDFLIDQDKDEIYLCELNTIPGSLAFYLWEPLGKSFTKLTDRLIELALKRYREVNNLIVSYEDNILRNW